VTAITTHVLDTSIGRPAVGVGVVLERGGKQSDWQFIGHGETDNDGRVRALVGEGWTLDAGLYRLVFNTRRYFEGRGVRAFYPTVIVTFDVTAELLSKEEHLHVPLLLSPFGYTTYRGS
jgi:5-hydroxyisourate hydrolase